MITAEKDKIKKSSDDVSVFLSDLNSAIDFRASSKEPQKDTINRFFYTIGSHNFLLEKDLKVENLSQVIINKVPHLHVWYEGITSVRGTIMPVINLRKFLQNKMTLEKESGNKTAHYLMINHAEHTPIILVIDKLPEMVDIKKYNKKKAPKSSPNWFKQTLETKNNKIINVNHKNLLNQLIESQ